MEEGRNEDWDGGMGRRERLALRSVPGSKSNSASFVLHHSYLRSALVSVWSKASQFRTWELFFPLHGLCESKRGRLSSELILP